MKKKQILAISVIVILLLTYIVTFVSAFFDTAFTKSLFGASLFLTFALPVLLYVMLILYKLFGKDKK